MQQQNDVHRDIGRLEARLDAMEDWAKSLNDNLAGIAKSMRAIEIELATAKGSAKVVIGVAALFGSFAAFVIEHVIVKRWF